MESFGKKNCHGLEVSDPNLERSGAKDAKVEESEDNLVQVSVRKFESFGRESCAAIFKKFYFSPQQAGFVIRASKNYNHIEIIHHLRLYI